MEKLKTLREKKARLFTECREILDLADADKRSLTKEENEKYDAVEKDLDECQTTIDRVERLARFEADKAIEIEKTAKEAKKPEDEVKERNENYNESFFKYLRTGINGLLPEDITTLQKGFIANNGQVRAPQTTQTDGTGGFVIPQGFNSDIFVALKSFGGVREVSRILSTETGNPMDWPLSDPTSNSGEWLAENTEAAEQVENFTSNSLEAWTASSKFIKAPIQFIQDEAINFEEFLRERLVERIGRLTNVAYTTGDGSSKPHGFVASANVGKTLASATTIVSDELFDLQHSLNSAYRNKSTWMFNDTTLKVVRKFKDSDGQYVFRPGLTEGAPDSLLGRPFQINEDMASLGASAKAIAIGDFSNYVIRDVLAMTIIRLNELFAEKLQIGWIGFLRTDGRLMAANTTTSNPIQVAQNAAT